MSAMNKKLKKGPSWFEVGLGALFGIILGAAVGAAYLVFKPVKNVKEIPKDAPSSAVYYIEGARDSSKSRVVESKRKAFAEGESVTVTEGELNVLLGASAKPSEPAPAPAPAPGKPGDKKPPASSKVFDVGPLNARIHANKIQFADSVSFNVFGFAGSVIVQARGDFKKSGSSFDFDPDVFYVGGCPMQRFLFVRGWIMKRLLFTQPVPDDIAAAWSKLADVTIDGSTLRLKMP